MQQADFHEYSGSELVIGLVGAVGIDLSQITKVLSDVLKGYEYTSRKISISREIIPIHEVIESSNEYNRIKLSMDLGNRMRENISDDVMALGVMHIINGERSNQEPRSRTAYIISSLKHEDEVKRLREVYRNGFYLLGVFSERDSRKSYLVNQKHMSELEAVELIGRDESENDGHGQHTRDTFQMSDFFIDYDDNLKKVRAHINRLVDLIFGAPFETPTFSEYAMFSAYCASLRSADLSRQIGAAICKNNEVLATGVNDCPQFGGGLYWRMFVDEYNGVCRYDDVKLGRDYTLECDPNKVEFQKIAENIMSIFNIDPSDENLEKFRSSKLADLTEYGRVVHAEMEALAMCARNNMSCRDGEIYVTTFPCHNCAKHLIAAGIRKVTYIEPYPKSKAYQFYGDSISNEGKDLGKKVVFSPFIGVGPTRFVNMFSMKYGTLRDRKRKDKSGIITKWEKRTAEMRDQLLPTSYIDRETVCALKYGEFVKELNNLEGEE